MNTAAERVLLVEDDPDLLGAISTSLKNSGIEVLAAASSPAACKFLREGSGRLLLLDWNLSGFDSVAGGTGSEVLRTCRQIDPFMPVIVMSGENSLDVRTDAVLEEADSFLAKPFSMALLVTHVQRWLKRRRYEQAIFGFQGQQDVVSLEEIKRRYARWAVGVLGSVNRAAPRLEIHRHTLANLVHETGDDKEPVV